MSAVIIQDEFFNKRISSVNEKKLIRRQIKI